MYETEIEQEVEWRLCQRDPIYFMENYWKITAAEEIVQHYGLPDHVGLLQMRLWDYQREFLQSVSQWKRHLVVKSRQIGFTTLVSAYCVWMVMFRPHTLIIYLSETQDKAKDVVKRMRHEGIRHLPEWMLARCAPANSATGEVVMTNGSEIKSMATRGEPARGYTPSLVVMDEWAHFDEPERAWRSIQPALSAGGRCIAMTTADGAGTTLHKQWLTSCRLTETTTDEEVDILQNEWVAPNEPGVNGFVPHFFPWQVLPFWDEKKYAEQMKVGSNVADFGQEHPSTPADAFLQAGFPFFDPELVARQGVKGGNTIDPQLGELVEDGGNVVWHNTPLVTDDQLVAPTKVWVHPEPHAAYIIGVDPAGQQHGGDNSSLHVLHEKGYVVAAWCGNRGSADEFVAFLSRIGRYYNNAHICIELNNNGQTIAEFLLKSGYSNLYHSVAATALGKGSGTTAKTNAPGLFRTPKNKPVLMSALAVAMDRGTLLLPCADTKRELREYINLGKGRSGAPSGGHDDRVDSLSYAVHAWNNWAAYPSMGHKPEFPGDRTADQARRLEGRRMMKVNRASYDGGGAVDYLLQSKPQETPNAYV